MTLYAVIIYSRIGKQNVLSDAQDMPLRSVTWEMCVQTAVVSQKTTSTPDAEQPHHADGLPYLIVRLEMQYFHIAFHTVVTSAETSDMPEKNVHGPAFRKTGY